MLGDRSFARFQQGLEVRLAEENRHVSCLCLSGKGLEEFAGVLEFLPEQFTKVVLVYGANEAYKDGGNAWTDAPWLK